MMRGVHAWAGQPRGGFGGFGAASPQHPAPSTQPDTLPAIGRPASALRGAVLERLQAAPAAVTWQELAQAVAEPVGVPAHHVRHAVQNLARVGMVQRVGRKAAPGCNRGHTLFCVVDAGAGTGPAAQPWALLQAAWAGVRASNDAPARVVGAWAEFA